MGREIVDWELAAKVGGRFAPKGPQISLNQAHEVVEQIRTLSAQAVAPVANCTGMVAPGEAPQSQVVDRKEWISSNIESFAYLTSPLAARVNERGSSGIADEVGSRATAVQLGAALGWMSGKVLGQYEALVAPGTDPRLMLNAPTMLAVADELEVDQRDFFLWVCLHEETHRLQFSAVPWLASYMHSEISTLVVSADLSATAAVGQFGAIVRALGDVVRGKADMTELAKAVAGPGGAKSLDALLALMTLLEGHADVVMDAVGPEVVPSVSQIRERFNERRTNPRVIDNVMRKALGMDGKLKQYSEGAAFVQAVVDQVGMASFNQVWQSPETLPTKFEIQNPDQWISRVHSR